MYNRTPSESKPFNSTPILNWLWKMLKYSGSTHRIHCFSCPAHFYSPACISHPCLPCFCPPQSHSPGPDCFRTVSPVSKWIWVGTGGCGQISLQCLTSGSLSAKPSWAEPRRTASDGKIWLVCVQLVILCLSWPNRGNICRISCRPSWRTQRSCSMILVLQVSSCRGSYQQRLSSHKDILVGRRPCWCFLNVSKAGAGKSLHTVLSRAAPDVVF